MDEPNCDCRKTRNNTWWPDYHDRQRREMFGVEIVRRSNCHAQPQVAWPLRTDKSIVVVELLMTDGGLFTCCGGRGEVATFAFARGS